MGWKGRGRTLAYATHIFPPSSINNSTRNLPRTCWRAIMRHALSKNQRYKFAGEIRRQLYGSMDSPIIGGKSLIRKCGKCIIDSRVVMINKYMFCEYSIRFRQHETLDLWKY